MCLVNKHKFETRRVEFLNPVLGRDALHRRDCDIGHAAGMVLSELDLDPFFGICERAVPVSLVYEFLSMGKDQGLRGARLWRGYALYELGEDNLENGSVNAYTASMEEDCLRSSHSQLLMTSLVVCALVLHATGLPE